MEFINFADNVKEKINQNHRSSPFTLVFSHNSMRINEVVTIMKMLDHESFVNGKLKV